MKRFVLLSTLLGVLQASLFGAGTFQPLATTQAPAPVTSAAAVPAATVAHFYTKGPRSVLPSDATCAASVRPVAENKRMNKPYNATRGSQKLASNFFTGGDSRANTQIGVRVTGNYVGTTDQIIQWVACKWGIDEDIVRAQASLESWWRQTTKGNWTTNAARCAPGHGLGVDGKAGQCPGSWGVLQVGYYWYKSAWPGILNSTAFNLDTAYAVWRACYEGYELWLNDITHVGTYAAGDAWGCIGRWYAGHWHTPAAEQYIANVKNRLNTRFWTQAVFQEP